MDGNLDLAEDLDVNFSSLASSLSGASIVFGGKAAARCWLVVSRSATSKSEFVIGGSHVQTFHPFVFISSTYYSLEMTRFITGDELGHIKVLRYGAGDADGQNKTESKIVRNASVPNSVQRLAVASGSGGARLVRSFNNTSFIDDVLIVIFKER